jgi:branched-chain amino acid transport system substrate-binding protein
MRFKKILIFAVALLMVTMFMASCGEKKAEKTETVTIGLTAPLSGVGAGYGQDCKAGLEMAIKKVNDAGGVTLGDTKYTFKLEAADDQATPEAALANAQRFVLQQGINIVFCPYATNIKALMDINNKPGEEFLIMGYTSVPYYKSTPNPLLITIPPPFSSYIKPWIQMAMKSGWKKLAMIQTTGAYGDLWASTFEQAWTGAGGTVVAKAPASYYTTTDFTPYLTTLLAANPDVIFCGGPSEPTGLVIEQARGLGFKGGFIVIDQAKLDVIAEKVSMDKLEGAIGVVPVELTIWPYMKTFAPEFEAAYGIKTTWECAIHYTAFHVLVEAIKNAGAVDDVKAIRAAFADDSVTSGEKYPVEFSGIDDATGALLMPAQATMVKNGEFTEEEVIEWWKQ